MSSRRSRPPCSPTYPAICSGCRCCGPFPRPAQLVGSAAVASALYEVALPFRHLSVMNPGGIYLGSVEHHLGVMALDVRRPSVGRCALPRRARCPRGRRGDGVDGAYESAAGSGVNDLGVPLEPAAGVRRSALSVDLRFRVDGHEPRPADPAPSSRYRFRPRSIGAEVDDGRAPGSISIP